MITIAGAGPAGLLAAKEAASLGAKVTVYEEHRKVGEPVRCTGLVSKKGLDGLNVGYRDAVLNRCRGARIYSPAGQEIEIKKKETVAYVIDRAAFDRIIAEEAEAEGAEIVLGKKLEEGADVAADGPLSKWAPKREYVHAYQVTADLERDTEFVEIHWTPGFFAWVVPISEGQCRVGIGVRDGNPREALMRWLHSKGMQLEYEAETSGLIPLYDGAPAVRGGVCLVGDAAAHVKATSGGGIAIGGFNARVCGAVLGEGRPAEDYEPLWRQEWGQSLEMHRKVRDILDRIPPAEIEELFAIAKQEGIEKLIERHGDMERLWPLVSALLAKPGLSLRLMKYARYL